MNPFFFDAIPLLCICMYVCRSPCAELLLLLLLFLINYVGVGGNRYKRTTFFSLFFFFGEKLKLERQCVGCIVHVQIVGHLMIMKKLDQVHSKSTTFLLLYYLKLSSSHSLSHPLFFFQFYTAPFHQATQPRTKRTAIASCTTVV